MNVWLLAPLFIAWIAVVAFLRIYRVWLPYYIAGAVGCAYWLILVARDLFRLELLLAQSVAWSVHLIANLVGVPTRVFEGAPGVLMVMVIVQEVGWTVLQVGVESSGLLEISVLSSLLLFYPGWSLRRRLGTILLGAAASWAANILRMLIITAMLHVLGKEALVLAHTFIGKAVFFVLTIGIYWYLITLPTVRDLARRQRQANPVH